MKYKIGVCDDEMLHVKVNILYLQELAKRNGYEVSVCGFTKSNQVIQYLENERLDILFLDVDLGTDTGLMLATKIQKLYPKVLIVFITAHREYANEAFEVDAIGYLMKPLEEEKVEHVLKRAISQVTTLAEKDQLAEIVITEENVRKKIRENDIIYIQRELAKSVIHTDKKDYRIYETITSMCNRLSSNFIRVNQSEVVNVKKIEEIRDNNVYLDNGIMVSIGRTYRKNVLAHYFET